MARAEIFLVLFVRDTDVLVAGAAEREDNTVTGFALRAETVVFTALRGVVFRAVLALVETVAFLPRDTAFSVREAASALNMQMTKNRTKYRIFFISGLILANL